jgi:transcriptional regulator with XRE-family HTH domain
MAHKFEELRKQMSPERRRRARERTQAMLLAMDLAELRGSLGLTQEEIAERLDLAQSNVSRLERRDDMLVSTLRQVVEAYGGRLRLIAEFPEGTVEIGQFDR